MADKMSSEELQRVSSKLAAEVLQKVAQTLGGELEAPSGAAATKQFVFRCPGDFECGTKFRCSTSFTAVALETL
jgi:hypothetical protein